MRRGHKNNTIGITGDIVFKMYCPARNCAPVVSTARGMMSQHGVPSALERLGLAGLNGWAGQGSASSSRQKRSFSRRCLGGTVPRASVLSATRPQCTVPSAVPRQYLGLVQNRGFSKADHTQVSGDNQKTEELLEKFEIQEGNQEARPQHTILHEDNEGRRPPTKAQKWPERMTKGTAAITLL